MKGQNKKGRLGKQARRGGTKFLFHLEECFRRARELFLTGLKQKPSGTVGKTKTQGKIGRGWWRIGAGWGRWQGDSATSDEGT